MLTPEGMRAGAEPCSDGGRLRQQHQVELTVQERQVAGDERGEPVGRISAGTQGWWTGEDELLKLPLSLVEQRDRQTALVGEPPIERPLAHPGGGDVVHRDTGNSTFAEQPLRGGQHPQPVAGGVCALFHARRGDLRRAYHEGMEDQLGALGLVLNCITLWNTVYLDAALSRLRDEGYLVRDEDVVRLSAYLRRHLNVHGHYSFQLPDLAGTRRALRDPDAGDER